MPILSTSADCSLKSKANSKCLGKYRALRHCSRAAWCSNLSTITSTEIMAFHKLFTSIHSIGYIKMMS